MSEWLESLVDKAAQAILGVERSIGWDDLDAEERNAYRDDGRAATITVLRGLADRLAEVGHDAHSAALEIEYRIYAEKLENTPRAGIEEH